MYTDCNLSSFDSLSMMKQSNDKTMVKVQNNKARREITPSKVMNV